VVLTDPPPVVISPIVGSDTVCFGSNNEFYSVQGQAGYSYLWQSLGTITTGQGSPGISVDWSSTLPGYYTSAVQVQGFNQVGCNSQTEVFNLTVYYVDPVIDQIGPFCSVDDCVPITVSPLGGTLMGTGVNGSQFCPQGSLMNNNITYTYTQSGCTFEDSISVTVNPNPSITQIDPQNYFVETCDSAQVTFNATVTLPGTTVWNITGDTVSGNPASYTWFNAGVYTVTAVHTTGSCVSQPLTTTVTIQECPALLIYIPNTFTPDGDEHNHVWQPEFTSGHDPYRFDLVIFNRWGESIFESRNPTIGWDGIYANRPCPQGVYTYMITYGLEDNGRISTVIGHVNLIR
jgi:gliding motility-associated-like protein